jgi:hypothetical protein
MASFPAGPKLPEMDGLAGGESGMAGLSAASGALRIPGAGRTTFSTVMIVVVVKPGTIGPGRPRLERICFAVMRTIPTLPAWARRGAARLIQP